MRLHQQVQPQDGCLRNYTLSDWDLYTASNADALILAGSGLESFADTVSSLGENGPAVARVLGSLVLRTEEWGSAHFSGVNPWLFLSVEGARQISEAIAANMLELDPACENLYLANLHVADERLSALKTEMADILAGANLTAPGRRSARGAVLSGRRMVAERRHGHRARKRRYAERGSARNALAKRRARRSDRKAGAGSACEKAGSGRLSRGADRHALHRQRNHGRRRILRRNEKQRPRAENSAR